MPLTPPWHWRRSRTARGVLMSEIQHCGSDQSAEALNAATEAARAGEQGEVLRWWRDEVRTLPRAPTRRPRSRSRAAAGQIQRTLNGLKGMMQQNPQQTQSCVTLTRQGSESLHQVPTEIERVVDLAQISTAAESEQQAVVEDISRNVNAIS